MQEAATPQDGSSATSRTATSVCLKLALVVDNVRRGCVVAMGPQWVICFVVRDDFRAHLPKLSYSVDAAFGSGGAVGVLLEDVFGGVLWIPICGLIFHGGVFRRVRIVCKWRHGCPLLMFCGHFAL